MVDTDSLFRRLALDHLRTRQMSKSIPAHPQTLPLFALGINTHTRRVFIGLTPLNKHFPTLSVDDLVYISFPSSFAFHSGLPFACLFSKLRFTHLLLRCCFHFATLLLLLQSILLHPLPYWTLDGFS
ncbi:hypothetical protein IWX46DRAFT_380146 [Phyllosticta citricarpa]|uniref:Uncharacterized protein n=1 Tax=Phyllosticta citricarpa TaxID=55181 RepID=A0ABR1MJM5_9PEZI